MLRSPITLNMGNIKFEQSTVNSWDDLAVLHKAHGLVIEIYRVSRSFPAEERFGLTSQLRRAIVSVPTNIAEGKGRRTTRDYIQFLVMARGSVEEVKYLLLLARDLGYISEDEYLALRNRAEEIGKMLNGLISSLNRRAEL
jgi:four helix bundle protein